MLFFDQKIAKCSDGLYLEGGEKTFYLSNVVGRELGAGQEFPDGLRDVEAERGPRPDRDPHQDAKEPKGKRNQDTLKASRQINCNHHPFVECNWHSGSCYKVLGVWGSNSGNATLTKSRHDNPGKIPPRKISSTQPALLC